MVGRTKDNPNIRVVAHDKSSLAPEGKSIAFELDAERGFLWKGYCDTTVDQVLSGSGTIQTKTMQMETALKEMLSATGLVSADAIYTKANEIGVSERTLKIAKKNLGIQSKKVGDQWFWSLPKVKSATV